MQKRNHKKTLTIMVPALNEEKNLETTINIIKSSINRKIIQYEVIIFDDGSTDKTGLIADNLAKRYKNIKVRHNYPNKGLGYNYKKGQEYAKYEYYMFIPGDNQFPKESLVKVLSSIGETDIVVPFVVNMHIRPPIRQVISFTFTFIINTLFNLHVSYYNSQVIHRTEILKKVPQKTNGFSYQAEILVRLIKGGASYKEVGYEMTERQAGSTAAFTLRNIFSVFKTVLILFWEIQILKIEPISASIKKLLRSNS